MTAKRPPLDAAVAMMRSLVPATVKDTVAPGVADTRSVFDQAEVTAFDAQVPL
ncbi:hypothetical protein ABT301_27060 [Streptomyces sp. NPDC000987]|uniref:hypothetical protein n=1 Tax=Streptomyces sp. NPDC000987 TaxID=3154374 RepID=UPI0033250E66